MITNAYRDPFLAEMQRGTRVLAELITTVQKAEEFLSSADVAAISAAVSSASTKLQSDLERYYEHLRDARLEEVGIEEEEDYDLEDA